MSIGEYGSWAFVGTDSNNIAPPKKEGK